MSWKYQWVDTYTTTTPVEDILAFLGSLSPYQSEVAKVIHLKTCCWIFYPETTIRPGSKP